MTDLRKVDERFAGLDAKVDGRFADLSTKVDLMRDGMDNSFAMLREVIERRG